MTVAFVVAAAFSAMCFSGWISVAGAVTVVVSLDMQAQEMEVTEFEQSTIRFAQDVCSTD